MNHPIFLINPLQPSVICLKCRKQWIFYDLDKALEHAEEKHPKLTKVEDYVGEGLT